MRIIRLSVFLLLVALTAISLASTNQSARQKAANWFNTRYGSHRPNPDRDVFFYLKVIRRSGSGHMLTYGFADLQHDGSSPTLRTATKHFYLPAGRRLPVRGQLFFFRLRYTPYTGQNPRNWRSYVDIYPAVRPLPHPYLGHRGMTGYTTTDAPPRVPRDHIRQHVHF